MVRGNKKSHSLRRVVRKLPGGRITTHYEPRKPGMPVCHVTKQPLQGVARGTPGMIRRLSKTQRRPERPFGGVLSSKAMRDVMRKRARALKL